MSEEQDRTDRNEAFDWWIKHGLGVGKSRGAIAIARLAYLAGRAQTEELVEALQHLLQHTAIAGTLGPVDGPGFVEDEQPPWIRKARAALAKVTK